MSKTGKILLAVLIVVFVVLWAISGKYLDWLWFKTMGSTAVFWVSMLTGPLTKLIVGLVAFAFFFVNLLIALKAFDRIKTVDSFMSNISKTTVTISGLVVSAVLALFVATGLSLDWTVIQQFLHQVHTGVSDPIFKQDLGFYLFSFPFYQQLNILLSTVTFLGLAGTAIVYILCKAFWRNGNSWELWPQAKIHLTVLAILFLVVKIWGYTLAKFGLLYQETARLTGINYTAFHAKMLAYNFLIWLLAAIILVLLFSFFRRGSKLLIGGLLTWLGASMILLWIYPGVIQAFVVSPNEYELEKPYLEKHITWTRKAYGLDKIGLKSFSPDEDKVQPLNTGNPSLADLRLWDYIPLNPSYNQLQSIRPYYEFHDIDIDRYHTPSGERQVMISARELNTGKLSDQAHTWINLHLTYTHGYGLAANPVNQFTSQGQPVFVAYDLPPKVDPAFPSLKVRQPGIYFGEMTNDYIIVNTKTTEFDYPQGDQNISTTYQGTRGIPLASPVNKLLMAFKFQEPNFILPSPLTSQSSILIYRNITERINKLAPFLIFDDDPYLVVSGGKMLWVIDAYTASAYYPYAKKHSTGLNYIRNSVKAVVDAYTGEVNFYVIDPSDPLIQVWQRVFPQLFKSTAALTPDLVQHFRYPEFLLTIQRDMLLQYHMVETKTFYEKEDYWDVPAYNQDGQDQFFNPYYVSLKLPGEKMPEFVMMQPFSPRGKQNLISWLVARCDQPNYGKLQLFILPKDQNIYGPAQIDSRINQNQTISQLITLWNQHQSKVVWGNILIVPLEKTLLYVKPLFIESSTGQQAELKKVVMVYQNQVLLGDTVAEALNQISGGTITTDTSVALPTSAEDQKAAIIRQIESLLKQQLQNQNEQLQITSQLQQLSQELKNK